MSLKQIYTDGACRGNPGPGSWAVIVMNEDDIEVLAGGQKSTTNNQMELEAVIRALIKIEIIENESDYGKYEYEILSDSAYVVNALNMGWLNSWINRGWKKANGEEVKNKKAWEVLVIQLDSLTNAKIKFTKVKGHAGLYGNELADKIANEKLDEIQLEMRRQR